MGTERISTGKSACDVQSLLVTVPTNDVTDTFSFRNWFAITCRCARPPEERKGDRPSEEGVDKQPNEERAALVALIERQLKRVSVFREYTSARERSEVSRGYRGPQPSRQRGHANDSSPDAIHHHGL